MRAIALATTGLSVLLLALGVFVIPGTEQTASELAVAFSGFALAFVLTGCVLATRRSGNPVGWLMLAAGALMSVPVVTGQYAGYALFGGGDELPAARIAAWLGTWLYVLAFGVLVCLLLVFPAGRLEGRRRWLAAVAVPAALVGAVAVAILPGEMDGFPGVANPFGLTSLEPVTDGVLAVSSALVALTFAIAAVSVFARLRTARGDERQQLKWFAYTSALIVAAQAINLLPLGLDDSLAGLLAVVLSLLALPLAIGVAVLKYRLYDIDVVINRTLVYGSLTATLAATYLALVLLIGLAIGESDLAIAASTLAVAGAFGPARTRIQAAVDRRFYRRRYDAAQTLETFGGRLRDQVDLDALAVELRGVVGETMQPAHVSLWLRSTP
jgi:hypothetical protein